MEANLQYSVNNAFVFRNYMVYSEPESVLFSVYVTLSAVFNHIWFQSVCLNKECNMRQVPTSIQPVGVKQEEMFPLFLSSACKDSYLLDTCF